MEYIVINYLFDKGETVSEGICFTSQSKVTGLYPAFYAPNQKGDILVLACPYVCGIEIPS